MTGKSVQIFSCVCVRRFMCVCVCVNKKFVSDFAVWKLKIALLLYPYKSILFVAVVVVTSKRGNEHKSVSRFHLNFVGAFDCVSKRVKNIQNLYHLISS